MKKFIKKNKVSIALGILAIGCIIKERKSTKQNSRLLGIIENQENVIRGYKKTTEGLIFNAGKRSRAL